MFILLLWRDGSWQGGALAGPPALEHPCKDGKPPTHPCASPLLPVHIPRLPHSAKSTWAHFSVPEMPSLTPQPHSLAGGSSFQPWLVPGTAPAQPPTLYPSVFPSAFGLLCWHFSPGTLDFVATLSSVMSGLYFKSFFMIFRKNMPLPRKT